MTSLLSSLYYFDTEYDFKLYIYINGGTEYGLNMQGKFDLKLVVINCPNHIFVKMKPYFQPVKLHPYPSRYLVAHKTWSDSGYCPIYQYHLGDETGSLFESSVLRVDKLSG